MFGAILGDIIGSRFEWDNLKSKEFELFTKESYATDDSIMTMALAKAIWDCDGDWSKLEKNAFYAMQDFGHKVPHAGYGGMFMDWLLSDNPRPYGSFGNGAGMRVSCAGLVAKSLDECKEIARAVTAVTHNHLEGIKGGESIAVCIWLARNGASKKEIRAYVQQNYYDVNFTCNDIRATYKFEGSAQKTNPQAIVAFLDSTDWEDAIRCAVSIGGDTDTVCAMTGAIAEAFYGVPSIASVTQKYCLPEMLCYVEALEVLHNNYPKDKILPETKELLGNAGV